MRSIPVLINIYANDLGDTEAAAVLYGEEPVEVEEKLERRHRGGDS